MKELEMKKRIEKMANESKIDDEIRVGKFDKFYVENRKNPEVIKAKVKYILERFCDDYAINKFILDENYETPFDAINGDIKEDILLYISQFSVRLALYLRVNEKLISELEREVKYYIVKRFEIYLKQKDSLLNYEVSSRKEDDLDSKRSSTRYRQYKKILDDIEKFDSKNYKKQFNML